MKAMLQSPLRLLPQTQLTYRIVHQKSRRGRSRKVAGSGLLILDGPKKTLRETQAVAEADAKNSALGMDDRIRVTLLGFATADALGAGYEFNPSPPRRAEMMVARQLRTKSLGRRRQLPPRAPRSVSPPR